MSLLRTQALLLATTTALFGTGCFLDSGAFETVGTGTSSTTESQGGMGGTGGGMGAASPAGGAGGTGGETTTTSTGTDTQPAFCDSADDCDDGKSCTADACDVKTNTCQFFVKAGKEIDDSDADCLKLQCESDGTATVIADADDKPPPDSNLCTIELCDGTIPTSQNRPDGVYVVGDCGEIMCSNGVQIGDIADKVFNCVAQDNSLDDCSAPQCIGTECKTPYVVAPQGWPCKKPNQTDGQCDGGGSGLASCK